MGDSDIEGGGGGSGDDGFRSPIGRKYRPVLANDRAVLEMSSMDPGSSSSASTSAFPDPPSLRYSRSSISASSTFSISMISFRFGNPKSEECERIRMPLIVIAYY